MMSHKEEINPDVSEKVATSLISCCAKDASILDAILAGLSEKSDYLGAVYSKRL
jgi:hypothetical protein